MTFNGPFRFKLFYDSMSIVTKMHTLHKIVRVESNVHFTMYVAALVSFPSNFLHMGGLLIEKIAVLNA